MVTISPAFSQFMGQLHGAAGVAWVERLPDILAAEAERWQLRLGDPFNNLTYHFVLAAWQADGTPVVLKACSPTGEYALEAAALRLADGEGMVRLLAADDHDEVLLLERLEPGTSLLHQSDDALATRLAADVMRRLWRPVPPDHPFPTVARWHLGFQRLRQRYGGTGPFPAELVARAEHIYDELVATAGPAVVMHGDLHHDNILAAQRQPYLAIDPKGLVGDPIYEVGTWLRNPLPQLLQEPDPAATLARRVAILAEELGTERARVLGWGLYGAVLSAWWSVEDLGQPDDDTLACAQILADLKP